MMRRTGILVAALAAAVLAAGATAWAQHGHGGAHGRAGGHQRAEAGAAQFEEVVREGRGFGMAFVADQHGYPGPMHVLELADTLALTGEQAAAMQALMHAMFAEARPRGAALLEAEARLRALFAGGAADEAAVRAAVADVEGARAALRLVHLLTHLRARDVLTEAQRARYHAARWPPRP